jgi:hypothetical protein
MTPSEMFDSLPQEIKDAARNAARERFKDDRKMLEFIAVEEDLDSLNNQLCNTLGLLKAMLLRFDETKTGVDYALENIKFFHKFMAISKIPLENLCNNTIEFHKRWGKRNENES